LELIAVTFGYLLKFIFSIVGNYGWAIVIFSFVIKLILLPFTLKQHESVKKSQELQPKLAEIQEKYANDQEKLALEYQKFMTENKYNPFGGCLISILQIFIILGIFYVVRSPLTYMEKLSKEEVNDKIKEYLLAQNDKNSIISVSGEKIETLSINSGDSISGNTINIVKENNAEILVVSGENKVATLITISGDNINFINGEEVNTISIEDYKNRNRYIELTLLKELYGDKLVFLGIDLGDITSNNWGNIKLWIIPVLTVITYYISLYMVSKGQKTQTQKMKDADGNEIEMPNMMAMNFTMPLLSGWIALTTPQGMGLYWFASSLFQIISQFFVKKKINSDKDSENSNVSIINKKNPSRNVIETEVEEIDGKKVDKPQNTAKSSNKKSKKKKKK